TARALAVAITDADERDWALDEIARSVADKGDWSAAFALAGRIGAIEQRDRTEADLTIAWARAGHPLAAHAHAQQLALPASRLRAYVAIVGPLVAHGGKAAALATLAQFHEPDARSRYQAALAA